MRVDFSKPIVDGGTISPEELAVLVDQLHAHTHECPGCGEYWGHFTQEYDQETADEDLGGDFRCPECWESGKAS